MLDFSQIVRSPLNKSTSKQLFSFPRANRFDKSRQSPCKNSFYETIRGAISKRSTSFGYGNKITLQNKQKVPPPGQYEKDGQFLLNIKKRRGYSFGHDSKRGIVNEQEVVKIPGPGKYDFKSDKINYKKVSYSMRGKFQDPLSLHQNLLGPGQYQTIADINSQGKYFVSKFSSSGCSKVGNAIRFQPNKTLYPGPGNYNDEKVTGMSKTGLYFPSGFESKGANSFSHSPRQNNDDNKVPGPGSQQNIQLLNSGLFSQFPSKMK